MPFDCTEQQNRVDAAQQHVVAVQNGIALLLADGGKITPAIQASLANANKTLAEVTRELADCMQHGPPPPPPLPPPLPPLPPPTGPRIRINFRELTLFEDEESGDTHMAMYATVRDSSGSPVVWFKWNNRGVKVNETNVYPLNNDPGNLSVLDFQLDTFATVTVEGYAKDDQDWPTSGSNENSLGSASVTIDPRVPATLGSVMVGPTKTDQGNTGYFVIADIAVVGPASAADVRLRFEDLVLYEDEEVGDTHMAIYVRAQGPGINRELFRWNNGGVKVNEVNVYGLDNSTDPVEVTFLATGPTAIIVDGYAKDDHDWPSAGSNENALGTAIITVDPSDPASAGQSQLGPTKTDQDHTGYLVNLSVEILEATPQADLSIAGIEVTQAIQHFHSTLGADNTVPLVAHKTTLVRAYLDSGVDPGINNGEVPGVTGTLTATGDANLVIDPISPLTARPIAALDPTKFSDTLNFRIPAEHATGTLNLVVQAIVGAKVSNPERAQITFTTVGKLNILMVRVQTQKPTTSAPTREQYYNAINALPHIYPIPTDPGAAINYWLVPGSEVVVAHHDLTTISGMDDFLNDLEDIQEDAADYKKLYGLVSQSFPLKLNGDSRPYDNVAFGLPLLKESVGHELGHLYGLDHAPCGNPDNPDDDFVPPNGTIGEFGVDPLTQTTSPPTVGDFMSYCSGEAGWVSAYHWEKLLAKFRGL